MMQHITSHMALHDQSSTHSYTWLSLPVLHYHCATEITHTHTHTSARWQTRWGPNNTGGSLSATNCPITVDAPLLCSWKLTSETMILSSRTDPHPVHTASPRDWSYSMSEQPQWLQTVDIFVKDASGGHLSLATPYSAMNIINVGHCTRT